MLFDYQKRSLKDFFKNGKWDFEGLLKHCEEQMKLLNKVKKTSSFKGYYSSLKRICELKLKGGVK